MSRIALTGLAAVAATILCPASSAAGQTTHLDPGLLPSGCPACHRGHGQSGSPMLPAAQTPVCLSCHGTGGARSQRALDNTLLAASAPELLYDVFLKPFTHRISDTAFSRREPGVVTCSSCHSPHRTSTDGLGGAPLGTKRISTRDPTRFEHELCESCHGAAGSATMSVLDISRLFSPTNPSYHPVHAPSVEGSQSVLPELAGREINCTDCHGNDDPAPLGPHGSNFEYILRYQYALNDGTPESASTYALCYTCHDRAAVQDKDRSFKEHDEHVLGEDISCNSCHNPHGSINNRALIRIGDDSVPGVFPSQKTGRLEFNSTGPGSGECYLMCHGEDHDPFTY